MFLHFLLSYVHRLCLFQVFQVKKDSDLEKLDRFRGLIFIVYTTGFCARLGFGDDIEAAEEKRSRRMGVKRVTGQQPGQLGQDMDMTTTGRRIGPLVRNWGGFE